MVSGDLPEDWLMRYRFLLKISYLLTIGMCRICHWIFRRSSYDQSISEAANGEGPQLVGICLVYSSCLRIMNENSLDSGVGVQSQWGKRESC